MPWKNSSLVDRCLVHRGLLLGLLLVTWATGGLRGSHCLALVGVLSPLLTLCGCLSLRAEREAGGRITRIDIAALRALVGVVVLVVGGYTFSVGFTQWEPCLFVVSAAEAATAALLGVRLVPRPSAPAPSTAQELRSLVELLSSLFAPEEFHAWVVLNLPEAVAADLPPVSLPSAAFFLATTQLLVRRGEVGEEFFAQIQRMRPRRAPEVEALAQRWHHVASKKEDTR